MALDNKVSNIIGAKLPQWLLEQLETRSLKAAKDSRTNDDILFITNKSAWIRLVSSVNVTSEDDLNYFRIVTSETTDLNAGSSITDQTSLAKNYVLFGGTSKYLNNNSYGLRSGFGKDGSYGMLGINEIRDFGYKPMPGITSVSIETQGKLGSVRAATINFKCWDKNQLDIIDALYFKLGFTMFLEWGHTYFYPSPGNSSKLDPDRVVSTELYSIDPFESGLTKEEINIKIARNSRITEGNYDGMLGMVTNFNFTYNQDGGYDCTVKLLGLGALGDSIKINNSGTLPALLEEEIVKLNKTLADIEYARQVREAAAAAAAAGPSATSTTETPKTSSIKAEEFFKKYITYYPDRANKYSGGQVSLSANKTESYETIDAVFTTDAYGSVYFIRQLKGFIPIDPGYLSSVKVSLNPDIILSKLNSAKRNSAVGVSDPRLWEFPANYLENAKDIISKPITSLIKLITESIPSAFSVTKVSTGETELDKKNDTGEFVVTYSSANGRSYSIKIKRKLWATSDRTDIIDSFGSIKQGSTYSNSAYYYIDTETFVNQFKNVLNNTQNTFTIKEVSARPNETTTTFFLSVPFTRKVKVNKKGQTTQDIINPDGTVTKGGTGPDTISDEDVTFLLYVEFSITDSSIIKGFVVPDSVIEPVEFKAQQAAVAQNQVQDTAAVVQQAPPKPDIKAIATQVKQSLNYQSSLEVTLRTIQVHALNKAINQTGKPDLEIGKTTYVLPLYDSKDIVNYKDPNSKNVKAPFLTQIFSTGVFSNFIIDLVNNRVDQSAYTTVEKMDPLERFKIQAAYGFATSLMANKADIDELEKVNFLELLKAYVVPYQINQEIIKGTVANHPVYIPLGLLLMILNHSCTIYDTKEGSNFQTPLVYIDFNPELNFCLTNQKQLSTDPWTCLVPFEGSFEDFKALFDKSLLSDDGKAIQGTTDSKQTVPLFNPEKQDFLSGTLPKLKFDDQPIVNQSTKEGGNVYRGKMMNILLSVDYLVQLAQQYSLKDGTNSVYLKTYIEQVLSDINKSLGNFNIFRLSYNDTGNTFQIIDDQVLPTLGNEQQVTPRDNTTELPLLGKFSIAKNIEIKTEMSSKLANMIAISANSTVDNKATLSTNGDSVGFINTNFVDRYIKDRLEITGSIKSTNDALKISAQQFNSAIEDFYSKINPSPTTVSHATNYYMEKMSNVKNADYATRASYMIPLSLNFTTDGISGMGMGQAFTAPDKLLPYTYTTRKTTGFSDERINNVGFVVVGLNHTIENNQWNTSVRANMIFLKDKTEFKGDVLLVEGRKGTFGINQNNVNTVTGYGGVPLTSGTIVKGKIEARPYTFAEITTQVIAHIEGGYFHPNQIGRPGSGLADTPRNRQVFQSSGETMFGIDRKAGADLSNTPLGKAFWAIMDGQNASSTWTHEYIPPDPLKTQILNAVIALQQQEFTRLFNNNIKSKDLQNLITNDGRLYFNFVYATWNGSGYFQGFSQKIVQAYDSGVKSPDELLKLFINLRLNIRQMPAFADYAQWAVDLIANGGRKIAGITGVQLA